MSIEFVKAESPALAAVVWNGRMLGHIVPVPTRGRRGLIAGDGSGKTGASLEGFKNIIWGRNYDDCRRRVLDALNAEPNWPAEAAKAE